MRKITFSPDHYYHVYNRGTEQRVIFLDPADYQRFTATMGEYRHGLVVIVAYVLMPNHFHLLVQPCADDSLSRYMHRLGTSFTMYFNARYERSGGLFQGTYKAVAMDSTEQLLHVSRYIHGNPVKDLREHSFEDRMQVLDHYPWSSYPDYVGGRTSGVVGKEFLTSCFLDLPTPDISISNESKTQIVKKVEAKPRLTRLSKDRFCEPRFEEQYREFMGKWLKEIVKAKPRAKPRAQKSYA